MMENLRIKVVKTVPKPGAGPAGID
jgi:hypothetical protein